MPLRIAYSIIAVVLMLLYLSPVLYRLKQVDISIVAAIGVTMMLIDVWQSLKSKEEEKEEE